jgi:hypothetical protein
MKEQSFITLLPGGLLFQTHDERLLFHAPFRWTVVVTAAVADRSIILLPAENPTSQWMNESAEGKGEIRQTKLVSFLS